MLSEEALWLHQQVLVSRLTLQPPSPDPLSEAPQPL